MRVLRWFCSVKPKPKAVNKPLPHFILRELDKPGSSATVSNSFHFFWVFFVTLSLMKALMAFSSDRGYKGWSQTPLYGSQRLSPRESISARV